MQASGQAPAALQAKLPTYLKDAEAFVSEGLEAADEPQPRQQTLGELLLGLPPPQPTQSHLSDAGLVLDHQPVPAAAAAAVAAMAAAAAPGQQPAPAESPQDQQQQQAQEQQQEQEAEEADGTAEQQQDPESIAAMLQESLLQANGANRAEIEAMLIRYASCHSMYGATALTAGPVAAGEELLLVTRATRHASWVLCLQVHSTVACERLRP